MSRLLAFLLIVVAFNGVLSAKIRVRNNKLNLKQQVQGLNKCSIQNCKIQLTSCVGDLNCQKTIQDCQALSTTTESTNFNQCLSTNEAAQHASQCVSQCDTVNTNSELPLIVSECAAFDKFLKCAEQFCKKPFEGCQYNEKCQNYLKGCVQQANANPKLSDLQKQAKFDACTKKDPTANAAISCLKKNQCIPDSVLGNRFIEFLNY